MVLSTIPSTRNILTKWQAYLRKVIIVKYHNFHISYSTTYVFVSAFCAFLVIRSWLMTADSETTFYVAMTNSTFISCEVEDGKSKHCLLRIRNPRRWTISFTIARLSAS